MAARGRSRMIDCARAGKPEMDQLFRQHAYQLGKSIYDLPHEYGMDWKWPPVSRSEYEELCDAIAPTFGQSSLSSTVEATAAAGGPVETKSRVNPLQNTATVAASEGKSENKLPQVLIPIKTFKELMIRYMLPLGYVDIVPSDPDVWRDVKSIAPYGKSPVLVWAVSSEEALRKYVDTFHRGWRPVANLAEFAHTYGSFGTIQYTNIFRLAGIQDLGQLMNAVRINMEVVAEASKRLFKAVSEVLLLPGVDKKDMPQSSESALVDGIVRQAMGYYQLSVVFAKEFTPTMEDKKWRLIAKSKLDILDTLPLAYVPVIHRQLERSSFPVGTYNTLKQAETAGYYERRRTPWSLLESNRERATAEQKSGETQAILRYHPDLFEADGRLPIFSPYGNGDSILSSPYAVVPGSDQPDWIRGWHLATEEGSLFRLFNKNLCKNPEDTWTLEPIDEKTSISFITSGGEEAEYCFDFQSLLQFWNTGHGGSSLGDCQFVQTPAGLFPYEDACVRLFKLPVVEMWITEADVNAISYLYQTHNIRVFVLSPYKKMNIGIKPGNMMQTYRVHPKMDLAKGEQVGLVSFPILPRRFPPPPL
jgi:hypothetical protein